MALGRPNVVKSKSSGGGGHISLRPSDAESGGLLDDVNAEITVSESCTWDYNGQQEPGPALHIQLKSDDGSTADQYYSAGKLNRIIPSEDGEQFDPAEGSSAKGLNDGCNAFVFLSQVVEKGFPEDKLESLGNLAGLYAHFNRVPQKKRAGLSEDSEGRARTILVVTKIHNMPWEKRKGKAPAGAPTGVATKKESATNGHSDLNEEAVAAVLEVLGENDGTIPRKKLGMAVYKATADSPNRSKLLKLVASDEFLAQDDQGFVLDGDDVTAS